jgi:hypothetical protein
MKMADIVSVEQLWPALIGAAIGFISTYLTAVVKLRQDLRAEYDKDLRGRRIPEYIKLWKLTDLFPKYGRTKDPTAADVREFTVSLKDWYFEGGGMLLSKSSRDTYFALQDALGGLPALTLPNGRPLDEAVYERIRKKCSALRTALVEDVGSRRGPVVDDKEN